MAGLARPFDTWGCRFYHRNAGWSPCEGGQVVKYWVIRLLTQDGAPPPMEGKPLANEAFVAIPDGAGSKQTVGTTDDAGVLRVRVHEETTLIKVKIADMELVFDGGKLEIVTDDATDTSPSVRQRLYNLGYGKGDWATWQKDEAQASLTKFQKDTKVSKSEWGTGGPETNKALKKAHDELPGAGADAPAADAGSPSASP